MFKVRLMKHLSINVLFLSSKSSIIGSKRIIGSIYWGSDAANRKIMFQKTTETALTAKCLGFYNKKVSSILELDDLRLDQPVDKNKYKDFLQSISGQGSSFSRLHLPCFQGCHDLILEIGILVR